MFEKTKLDFEQVTKRAFSNLEALLASPQTRFSATPIEGAKAGVYVLYEKITPVYVGRTRNLKQRFRARHSKPQFCFFRSKARKKTAEPENNIQKNRQ